MELYDATNADLVGLISGSFDRYVDSFKVSGELPYLMELKRRHSYRVREEALAIARSCGIEGDRLSVAFAVGLLHDLGRFPQYLQYGTFNDGASVDHGNLGCLVLEERFGHLRDAVGESQWGLIKSSVGLHNKRTLPDGLTKEERFWASLARDADRLDVYRVIVGHLERGTIRTIIPRLPEAPMPPSDQIVEELISKCSADYSMVRSLGDLLLVQICWVYDMSFPWSMGEVLRRRVVHRIGRFVPQSSGAKKVIEGVLGWLGERCRGTVKESPAWAL